MKVPFQTVDVFTDRQFGGNPVAVIPDARGLSEAQMQAIADTFRPSTSGIPMMMGYPPHLIHPAATPNAPAQGRSIGGQGRLDGGNGKWPPPADCDTEWASIARRPCPTRVWLPLGGRW